MFYSNYVIVYNYHIVYTILKCEDNYIITAQGSVFMEDLIRKFDKVFIFFIIYTIVFFVFIKTLTYTIPFVLAIFFASILQRPTVFLIKKCKLNNSVASFITTIILCTAIILVLILGVINLTNEIPVLSSNIQNIATQNYSKFTDLFNNFNKLYKNLDPNIVSSIEKNVSSFMSNTVTQALNISAKAMYYLFNLVTYIPYIIMVILFTFLSTYFFTKDFSSARSKLINMVPSSKSERFTFALRESKRMLLNYLLSYLIFMIITFAECLIVFFVLGINYSVLLSILAGICDLVPIIGIGIIFIPLILVYLIYGNFFIAISLFIAYIAISIIRQILGPKVVSSTMGLNPVASLAALFIGIEAGGIIGMLFCIFLLVFYNILKNIKVL